MKKTLLGIAGILAIVSSANAINTIGTAQIKAACQASDKALWVERNQVCIPRNPCDNPKYNKYCNRDYANLELAKDEYLGLVNYYAGLNNLDCKAVQQEAAGAGNDYVVCMGNDVMVFEFDDIDDANANTTKQGVFASESLVTALCSTMGGAILPSGLSHHEQWVSKCSMANKNACETLNKYYDGFFGPRGDHFNRAEFNEEGNTCDIYHPLHVS